MLDRLEHIALAVDEYGGVAGVVTMEDVVETLLGLEIVDEADSAEDMQLLARRQWLARARRLGIVPPQIDESEDEQLESLLRFGITGAGGAFPLEDPGSDVQQEAPRDDTGEFQDERKSTARP